MRLIPVLMMLVTICLIMILSGCQHDDGWNQDEIDWVISNV